MSNLQILFNVMHRLFYSFLIAYLISGCDFNNHSRNNSNRQQNRVSTDHPLLLSPPKLESNSILSFDKKPLRDFFRCQIDNSLKKLVKACNYNNQRVKNFSNTIAGNSPGEYNIGQVCYLYDHFRRNWKYVNDSRLQEHFSSASNSIKNGLNGDCDDFAIVLCSSILSIGGIANINFAYGASGGHAFTEVKIPKHQINNVKKYLILRYNVNNIYGRYDKNGDLWLNLDWQSNYPGGKYFKFTEGVSFYLLQNNCQNF